VVILEAADGQVTGMNYFLDTETMFPLFGLPDHLDP
jgi:RNA polymerase sigma-70 factor (ECF subfamily)